MERMKLKCSKCGEEWSVHPPAVTTMVNGFVALLCISPTWSIDERACPGCGTFYGPVFQNPQIAWAPVERPKIEEPKRIVVPGLNLPADFKPRG